MNKILKISILATLCILAVLVFASCSKSGRATVKMNVVNSSVEEAVATVEGKGATAVVVNVYDESNADDAVLSFDSIDSAKEGDCVTVAVNKLSLKQDIENQPLVPRIIEKKSYESLYGKLSDDVKKKFDTFYTLRSTKEGSDKEKAEILKSYPMASDMEIYVLDTKVSDKELTSIEEYVKGTGYSYENMFNDYVTVGIVPTPTETLKAEAITTANSEIEETEDGKITVVKYNGSSEAIVIPSQIDGKDVVSVAEAAFQSSTVHAVCAQENVISLGEKLCPNAYGLMNISIADTVNEIATDAFAAAQFTEEKDGFVTLDTDYLVKYTGSDADVVIPDTVTMIGSKAFESNTTLKSVTIPEGVQTIGDSAFKECTALSTISIPSTCIKICDNAFYHTRALTDIVIPEGVKELGNSIFFESNAVKSIKIGNTVTKIGDNAFYYCFTQDSIADATVDIPDSVEYIGNEAFYKCQKLTNITGMKNVKYVGALAFNETPWYISKTDEFTFINDTILIKYGAKEPTVTLPAQTKILTSVFYLNTKSSKVIVNDGCEMITRDAFTETSKLKEVVIPASVTYIDEKAFTIGKTMTIHCEAGSYAETFAKENHITYDNNMK